MSPGAKPAGARILVACGLSGAGVMMVELTATRLFAPWFGSSIYSWTNVIAVVLLTLAAGYAAGGRLADRRAEAGVIGRLVIIAAVLIAPATLLAGRIAPALMPAPDVSDPASATVSIVAGSFAATLLLFGAPLVILGAVTPFTTRLLVDRGVPAGRAAGRTLAVSTIGSLVGTYLPTLVLIDLVGSRGTMLSAAGVLLASGLLFGGLKPRGTAAAALACMLAIGGGWAYSAGQPIVPPTTHGEVVLAERESSYQYIRVARWPGEMGSPASLNLSIDEGILEFHSRKRDGDPLTGVYYDAFAVLPDWIAGADERPLDVLVIGGGAGTMRGMLRTLQGPRVRSIVDVEVDPVVAGFAKDFGGPAADPDRVLVADGRVALATLQGPFDLVILDAYTRQLAIPPHLASREAFDAVRARLSPRGLFAVNVSTFDVESPVAAAVTATLQAVFGKVWSVSVPGTWTVVLIAGDPLPPHRGPRTRGDALDGSRKAFLRSLHEMPPSDGLLLTDDRAPMESLARRVR